MFENVNKFHKECSPTSLNAFDQNGMNFKKECKRPKFSARMTIVALKLNSTKSKITGNTFSWHLHNIDLTFELCFSATEAALLQLGF